MKNLKRMISTFLVLILCIELLPLSALADAPYEGNQSGSIVVTVKDALTDSPMAGASVMLEDITAGREHNHGTQTSRSNGQVSWTGLSSGWYRVTETAVPEGYTLNSEEKVFYFDTESQRTYHAEIRNRTKNSLYIYRVDPSTYDRLSGAGYVVYDSAGHTVGQGTTNEDGVLIINNLPAGQYTAQEVSSPAGHIGAGDTQTFSIVESNNEPYVLIFTGSEESTITIMNYDGKTGAPIQGSKWIVQEADGNYISNELTTDIDGLAYVSGLKPGSYWVRQRQVATGYVSELKSAQVVIGNKTTHAVVSLANIKPGSITVHVGDAVTGGDLPGAQFTLYNRSGSIVAGPSLSDQYGYVTFDNVEDGHYTVVATPAGGYEMDTTSVPVSMTNGGDRSLSLTATPLGSLVIKTISETDGATPLGGCSFEVHSMDGKLIGEYTTASNGSVQLTGLSTGYYVINELRAPDGYVIESASQTAFVKAGTTATITFTHRDRPYVTVQCYIKGTTEPVPGSVVRLYAENGTAVNDGTIKSDGSYTFLNVAPGKYTVEYISAPKGYTIETPNQTVEVTNSKGGLATLYATRHSSILIYKIDGKTKATLPDATFIVRNSQGTIAEILTTDATGAITTKPLDPGTYTVYEQFAPGGYTPAAASQTVTVKNDEMSIVTFSDYQESAIVVYAYDLEGNPIPNVSYVLYNAITGQEVATQLTNTSGIATFAQATPGYYMVSQAGVPDGYVLTSPTQTRITLNAGEPTYVRFAHTSKATVLMQTVDINTGIAIPGAVYQVANETGSFVANYTADSNGEVESMTLEPGTYLVKQIVAPEGYALNTTTQTISVQRNRTNLAKFSNRPLSRIVVETVISGENFGLSGATITIENSASKEVARGTTTEGGIFTSGDLEADSYTVKVIASPNGYTCIQKQYTVPVTTGKASTVKFEFTGNNHIIVNLTDAANAATGLPGSKFRIEAVDGDFATDILTDSAGHAISEALPNGKYMVHQISAPVGYLLDQSYQWATLDASGDTVLDFTNKRVSALTVQALTETGHEGIPGATFEVWEQNGKLIQTIQTDASGVALVDALAPGGYVVKEVGVPRGYTARTLSQTVNITTDLPSTLNFYHTVESALTVILSDADTKTPLAEGSFRITTANGDFVGNYSTGADGTFVVATLEAGIYNITQTKAPAGYILDTTSRSFTIKDGQAASLDITNHVQPELVIRAMVDGTRAYLDGATFEIWESGSSLVKTVTTDTSGIIRVGGLTPGSYLVKEVGVPKKYTARTLTQTVTVSYDTPVTVDFYHTPQAVLTVHKLDAASHSPLAGAAFRITKANGDFIGNYTTDESGVFTVSTMEAGTYYLIETKAPDGYATDSTPQTFVITDGQAVSLDIPNQKLTNLTVRALTEAGSHPLSGAKYEIHGSDGLLVTSGTTDNSGAVVFENLDPGTYTVQETVIPDGYTVRTLTQTVTISHKESQTVDFLHIAKSDVVINKTDAETGAALTGAEYRITKENGDYYGDYTTNSAGQILISGMETGTYTIVETKAPNGYCLDTQSHSFTVKENQKTVLDLTDYPLTDLTIRALTETGNNPLAGAEFEVRASDNSLVNTSTTDASGQVLIKDLEPGAYTIIETKIPAGYTTRTKTQSVTVVHKAAQSVDFLHTEKSTLTVNKTDAVTGAALADAEFRISKESGDFVGNYTTDEAGQITVARMEAGKYTIVETKAPDGYAKDSTPRSFAVSDDQPVVLNIKNYPLTDLTIRALTEIGSKPLINAEFEVRAANGSLVTTVATDATGSIVVKDLAEGTYTLVETRQPDGWTARTLTQTITITNKATQTVDFFHTGKSILTVVKVDAETNEPLAGAGFRIAKENGDLYGDYVTNEAGQITVVSMDAGTYSITETKAPDGYAKDSAARSFTIKDDQPVTLNIANRQLTDLTIRALTEKSNNPLAEAKFDVKAADGSLAATVTTDATGAVVVKDLKAGTYTIVETKQPAGWTAQTLTQTVVITNKITQTVDFLHTEKSALTVTKTDAATGEVLANAEFRITKENGDFVGDYTTDKAGQIVIPSMDAGKYSITETKAPVGYAKDSAPRSFEIKDDQPVSISIQNYPLTDLTVRALSETGNKPLAGAEFEVRTSGGELVSSVTTDTTGAVTVQDLEPGTYTVTETITPDGWTARTLTQTITITNKTTQTMDFLHTEKSILTVIKVDAETDKPLAGAGFRITKENGDFYGDYTTDEAGQITVARMEAGKYSITETNAPEGYAKDSAARNFEIRDNQPVTLNIANYPLTDLTIRSLTAKDKQPLSEATFEIKAADGSLAATVMTDATGAIVVKDLEAGTYTISETKQPAGWTAQTLTQTVTITNKAAQTVDFLHTEKSILTVNKTDAVTGEALPAAEFRITKENGDFVGNYTTDDAGQITIASMEAGKYVMTETKAPVGYAKDATPKSFEIKDDQPVTINVQNYPLTDLTIRALTETGNKPLAGAEFEVRTSLGELVSSVTTDTTGAVLVKDLEADTYTITETVTPDGWTARTLTQTVTITNKVSQTIDFLHTEKSILTIRKTDAVTGEALAHAEFRITKENGDFYGDYTTDEAGQITVAHMEAGKYSITETKAPVGYAKDSTARNFEIRDNQPVTLDIENYQLTDLTIRSLTAKDKQPLSETAFEIKAADGSLVAAVTTDATGTVVVKDLEAGTYTVTETKQPAGWTAQTLTQTVVITNKTAQTVDFLHTEKSILTVNKTDAVTGEALAHAEFRITKENGDFVGNYTTDEAGQFTIASMDAGKYVMTETKAPAGYAKDSTPKSFEIKDDQPVTLNIQNYQLTDLTVRALTETDSKPLTGAKFEVRTSGGELVSSVTTDTTGTVVVQDLEAGVYTITETAEPDGWTARTLIQTITITNKTAQTIDFLHTEKSILTIRKTDAVTGEALAHAEFRITKENGDLYGDYTTDEAGQITIPSMEAGKYSITETKAPDGYAKDPTARSFEIKDEQPVTLNIKNYQLTDLTIRALTEKDKEPLAEAAFEIKAADGSLVASVTTDTTGTVVVKDLEAGTYTIAETKQPAGWTVQTLTQTVVITNKVTQTVDFLHTEKSILTINKTDAVTGEALAHAEFQITKENGDFVGNYTTDKAGQIVIPSMDAGKYSIVETKAPDGYAKDSAARSFEIQDDQPVTLNIQNYQLTDLTVRALTETDNKPLAGAEFEVRTSDGELVSGAATDTTGAVIIKDLEAGTYTITETVEPDGWTARTLTQTITITNKVSQTVDFLHTEKSMLTVHKTDAETKEPLAGAAFHITKENGDFVGDYTTDEAGQIIIASMEAGKYIMTETKAPVGYAKDAAPKSFEISDNQPVVLTIPNYKLTDLTIRALTETGNNPLTGAEFAIRANDGKLVATVTTDETGTVMAKDLEAGTYTITETKEPAGWTARTLTQTVTITNKATQTVDFLHTQKSTLTVNKTDAATGEALSGAAFRITKENGDFVGNYTTDEAGQIIIASMEAGKYLITETEAPEGYAKDVTPQSFEIVDGQELVLDIQNYQLTDLTVRALTETGKKPLAGAEFEIHAGDGKLVTTVTTDETGTVIVKDLEAGTYTLNEIKEPAGWTTRTPAQTVTITNEVSQTVDFLHTQKSTLTIHKTDAETDEPLMGAEFRITKENGDYVGVYTTDEAGEIVIASMEAGKYNITETKAPAGYSKDADSRSFEIHDGQPLVLNIPNYQLTDLTVRALTETGKKVLAGAEFEVRAADGTLVTTVTTDETGTVIVKDLEAGTYTLNEIKEPNGWTARTLTQTVTITHKSNQMIDFLHTQKSTLTINKKDAETGEPLVGAAFRITKQNGDYYGDFTTDKAGQIIIASMEAGIYNISETKAPLGYVLDTTAKRFEITDGQELILDIENHKLSELTIRAMIEADHTGLAGAEYEVHDEDGQLVTTVTSGKDGTVTVDSLTPGVYTVTETKVPSGYTVRIMSQKVTITYQTPTILDFWHTTQSSLTINKTDAETGNPLSGATFRITTEDGDLVGEYTTDTAGQILIAHLTAGTYHIVEKKAPEGYNLDTTSKTFVMEDNKPLVLDLVNYQKSNLTIKAITEGDLKGLGGAQYDICKEDGTVIKTVTTAGDGTVIITDLIPGNYLVKETKVPDGYTCRLATQTVAIVKGEAAVLTFYHTVHSTVTISKTDAITKKPLAGATFRITTSTGDVVGDYTTNASGQIVISSMAAGTYNIAETAAPDGYILDTTSKSFTVTDDKNVLLEITNNPVSTFRIVDTCKQDRTPIAGAIFKIYTYDGQFVGSYTTNEGGLINVNLAPGKYTLYQIEVPDGYVKLEEVWNIEIVEGKNNLLEVQNEKLTKVVVHVIDADSKAGIYGVSVDIKDINNNFIGSFNTDDSGNIYLTDVLNAGKYIISLKTVPHNYDKDTVPKTITVEIGKTTEITWALHSHKGQVTIVTFAGEDNATMNIRKNSTISGAIYQIVSANGQVVGEIQGNVNGFAYSGALAAGTYYFQQIVAPSGWQVNTTRFAVTVSTSNDNVRVEVYNKAANYETNISVSGTPNAMPGGNVKYNFNVANNSTSAMNNFFIHMKVPTDGMRAVTLYTGTYSGSATTYYVEFKTNMHDYRMLGQNLNSHSTYSYGLSTQALGLQTGEYVTDIRMVFTSVVAGMKTATAASLNCYVLATVPNGYQGIMRAECGAMNGYYSNNSNGGVYGNSTGQTLLTNSAYTADNGWVTSAGQFTTYVYAPTYYQNPVPSTLPKTGY